MTDPDVSIVIPTRARRQAVCGLVEALQHQEGVNFEIIVALDGDIDGTGSALEGLEVARRPALVRLASPSTDPHHGNGAGTTRNAGAARAAGKVLLFLDDDVAPKTLNLVALHLSGHADGQRRALIGTIMAEPPGTGTFMEREIVRWWRRQTTHIESSSELRFTDMATANLSISRNLFGQLNGFRAMARREDFDFGLRLLSSGVELAYCNGAAVGHRFDTDLRAYLQDLVREGAGDAELAEDHPGAIGSLPLDLYRHVDGSRRKLLEMAFLGRAESMVTLAAYTALRTLEQARHESTWLRVLQRATVLRYWVGVGRRLRSLDRLKVVLHRADQIARDAPAYVDINTGRYRLPGPAEPCDVRVLRDGHPLGTAPLRWGGLPFAEEVFLARIDRAYPASVTRPRWDRDI
ncbi:glycosyltransferase [Geodermatophilus sp. SYSU D00691]